MSHAMFICRPARASARPSNACPLQPPLQHRPRPGNMRWCNHITATAIVNVSWLPSLLLLAVSVGVVGLDVSWSGASTSTSAVSWRVACMYCLAACLESSGEAWVNTFNSRARAVPRLRAETAAVTVRSLVTLGVLASAHTAPSAATAAAAGVLDGASGSALLAFGYGQLAYGAASLAVLVAHSHSADGSGTDSGSSSFSFLPSTPLRWGCHEVALLRLCATTTGMSVFKHLLTEADKVRDGILEV